MIFFNENSILFEKAKMSIQLNCNQIAFIITHFLQNNFCVVINEREFRVFVIYLNTVVQSLYAISFELIVNRNNVEPSHFPKINIW